MEKVQEGQTTELAAFMKEIREGFAAAGKPKSGWLRNLLKKIFG